MSRICIIFFALAFVMAGGPTCAGDVEDAVTKAVLGPQTAGWEKHDFAAYMSQWADDAKIVVSRGEKLSKLDTTFARKQIEATRKLLMHGKAPANRKFTMADVRVKVDGDQAELRCRSKLTFDAGGEYELVDEIYRLRK